MTSNMPFRRTARLIIGPLAESAGGGPSNQAVTINSDGSRETLQIRFSAKKTLLSSPNASTITVTNLPPSIRDRIKTTLTKVVLFVGWENVGEFRLVSGALLSAVTEKDGPTYETVLSVMDGFDGQIRGVVSDSFTPGSTVADVVRGLAGRMPGVEVGTIDIDGSLPSGGFSFAGRAADALDALGDQYGFSWSIQDGIFQALQDTRASQRIIKVSSVNRNLLKAAPALSGPMQIENGVTILAVLDPRAIPGDQVDLESTVNPTLNGLHKMHTINFNGDLQGPTWTMEITSFKEIL